MTALTTRLHISPLSTDLLSSILGAKLCEVATNVSYHTLETFPENNYGFVDLPVMEAEKVKKKINGAILKGKKIKVEEARPKKRKHVLEKSEDEPQSERMPSASTGRTKRSRKDTNVLEGHELSPERKVKRGWTESKSGKSKKKNREASQSSAKSQATSKYTEKQELLFRTKIPKNKSSQEDAEGKKGKKSRDGTIVHEFEKSTVVPSFLRSEASGGKSAVVYQDGDGWLDEEGKVVEVEQPQTSRKREAAKIVQEQPEPVTKKKKRPPPVRIVQGADSVESADSDSTSDGAESQTAQSETSSSGSSSSGSSADSTPEQSAKSFKATPHKPSVHPLEALFKRPGKPASSHVAGELQDVAKPSLEVQTTFSFFDQSDRHDSLPPMPMTPFSSQDIRTRETRSAAPTPDTAHPSRMSSIFAGEESEGDLSEMEDGHADLILKSREQQSSTSQNLPASQTDFEKQFWEKRGDNNRAWKARRRTVLKEKRQRENRARRPKNW